MRQHTTPLLTQCPICGRGEINEKPKGLLARRRRRALPCPSCGATITPASAGMYRLSYCAPHKLGRQGCRNCAGYFYSMCFLDRALPLSDWERMARRKPPVEVEEFLARSRRLEAGELPSIEVAKLSEELAPGEVVHHFSQPVFTEDWHLPSASKDGGKLYVTDRRLLLCNVADCASLLFVDVEEVEEERPGFYVKLHGEREPRYFFPPPLDPVFSATIGALKRFRQAEASTER